jgi:hypothetical protein
VSPRFLLLVALPIALGCGDEPSPAFETEHLRFHGDLDGACAGLGRTYERELGRLESTLGRELLEPVDVLVGEDAVARHCEPFPDGRLPAGCSLSGTEVAATFYALSHELVHAIRKQHDVEGVMLVEEGLATMLGSSRPSLPLHVTVSPYDPDSAPIPRLEHDWSDGVLADRVIGAHFLRWVDESYGRRAWTDFLWSDGVRSGEAVEGAFADAVGVTMLAAQDRWSNEAEREAIFSELCWGTDAAVLPAEGLLVEGSACCSDPSVDQDEPPLLRLGRRCFTVPASTELQIELVAGDGELALRPDGCNGDVVVLGPGEHTTFTAPACTWQVAVWGPERCDEPIGFRYAITPL